MGGRKIPDSAILIKKMNGLQCSVSNSLRFERPPVRRIRTSLFQNQDYNIALNNPRTKQQFVTRFIDTLK